MSEIDKLILTSGFYGYELISVDDVFSKKVRVKTHKKKRIDKKWLKRYGYKRVPTNEIYVTADHKIFAHSKMIEAIAWECQRHKEDRYLCSQ